MAVGGRALLLDPDASAESHAAVLSETDTRLLLVDAPFSRTALELAARSRVRPLVAFGDALGTTPVEELLMPSPDGRGYSPVRGLFDDGVGGYASTADASVR